MRAHSAVLANNDDTLARDYPATAISRSVHADAGARRHLNVLVQDGIAHDRAAAHSHPVEQDRAIDHRAGFDTYRQHVLHVSESRRLSVVALVWLPGQRTPIHDHVAWCVVGVYRGVEREVHYRLVDRDGRHCLQPVAAFEAPAGHVEALVPPAGNIHSVAAAGNQKTISIHVYGADAERLGSSILRRFDHLEQLPGPSPQYSEAA